ncbi:hypothetical protein TWF694_011580 [Orbilia ellipsospora]|uniref:C2H2-type domain-containing protein n=1 Tax=Orbilia ellipsospora TaxID=2528407 RepID=A0AAV9XBV4_9PEZI
MPSVNKTEKIWSETILTASEDHVKTVLYTLCKESNLRIKVLEQLEKLQKAENPKKRKHSETKTLPKCTVCNQQFDESKNTAKSCKWHPGNREVDFEADCWVDMWEDDIKAFDFEDEDVVSEWPEGYRWDCCDEDGDHAGCMEGPHKGASAKSKSASPKPKKSSKRAKIHTSEE